VSVPHVSVSGEVGPHVLRFNIQPQDPKLDEDQIRLLLEEATKDAETAAKAEHAVSATLQVPGAFAGLGEISIAVNLLLPYLDPLLPYLEEAGKGIVGGVFTAAGEYFFHEYLAPRLRRRNLLPSDLQVETDAKAAQEPLPPSEKPQTKQSQKPHKPLKGPKKKQPKPAKSPKKPQQKAQRRK
jgi:hypothetical protein